jgi:4-aminobutyrate aminotransferase-like enzyme
MPGVIRTFDPYKYRSPLYTEGDSDHVFAEKCLAQIEETLMYEGPQTVAAFILETVTGTNGIIVPPDGYLQGLIDFHFVATGIPFLFLTLSDRIASAVHQTRYLARM